MISLGRETMTYKFYNSVFLSHGQDLSPDTEAATADQILPLVKCELGLAFLPQPMAAPSLLKKEIVQIPLKDEIPERQICLGQKGKLIFFLCITNFYPFIICVYYLAG